jgi:hypothetical protein
VRDAPGAAAGEQSACSIGGVGVEGGGLVVASKRQGTREHATERGLVRV